MRVAPETLLETGMEHHFELVHDGPGSVTFSLQGYIEEQAHHVKHP